MKIMKRLLSLAIVAALIVPSVWEISAKAQNQNDIPTELSSDVVVSDSDGITYASYIQRYADAPVPPEPITVDILNYQASSPEYAKIVEGIGGSQRKSLRTGDMGSIEWTVDVEEEGLYNICVDYYTDSNDGKGSAIVRSLLLDGEIPFNEAGSLNFLRVFTDDKELKFDADGNVIREFEIIGNGNEMRPSQVEVARWQSQDLIDVSGYYNTPFQFYFTRGTHKIRFESIREPMTIGGIKLYQSSKVKSYSEISWEYNASGYLNTTGKKLKIQGETAVFKSDSMIYPIADYSSPATEPSIPGKTMLNTIGKNKWQTNLQWIEWEFYVPETGLYKLGIKARQDVENGQPSYRRLYIDGKIPFKEAENIKIPFSTQWQMIIPGGENDPHLFYFEKGIKHIIRLEVTLGELSPILLDIKSLVDEYTAIYREILMIVGPSPDMNRDYGFESLIPENLEKLKFLSQKTMQVYDQFVKVAGHSGQQAQALLSMAKLADEMGSKSVRIPKKVSLFTTYISALGSLLVQLGRQPLEIDYISVISPDLQFERVKAGLLERIAYSTKRFVISFFTDYSAIDVLKEDAITVWIGNGATGGRDQANVLNAMITNYFTSRENINVNLQLVSMGALLPATLANKGPDIALTLGGGEPVNYAVRGAVADLTRFEDFEIVKKRFAPETFTPLTFDGKVYGLPETQSFPMIFYRTDIFNELGLSPPKTWDDVISLISDLQEKALQFGMAPPIDQSNVGVGMYPFAVFLYQNGGKFYSDDYRASALDSVGAIKAFVQWAELYTDYGLPYIYDAMNRFRTGEMPIVFQDYGFYNALAVAAPELNGKWDFATIPGTLQPDGTINSTSVSGVSACVIMEKCKNKTAAWKFLSWWTSAETQGNFGREIESILGPAARYQTANKEALDRIPWSAKDYAKLLEGREYAKGIPEVPGSYMTSRFLDFAIKSVIVPKSVTSKDNTANLIDPGRLVMDAAKQITAEIKNKRREFGLPD